MNIGKDCLAYYNLPRSKFPNRKITIADTTSNKSYKFREGDALYRW